MAITREQMKYSRAELIKQSKEKAAIDHVFKKYDKSLRALSKN